MPAAIKTLGRLRIGATVLPVTTANVTDGIVATPQQHSGLQQADNLLISGGETPRITAQITWGEAFAVFGLQTLNVTSLELFLGSLTGATVGAADAIRYSLRSGATAIGYISGFSVDQDGIALADVEIACMSSDGQTDPLERTAAQTMPAVSKPQQYTLGGVSINGSAIDGATGFSLSVGWTVATQRTDGDFFPTAGVCGNAAPVITVQHISPDDVRNLLGSIGVGISTTVVFTLKAVEQDTGIVNGTDQTLTVADGYVAPASLSAPHVQIANHAFTVHPISADGDASGIVVA